MRSAVPHYLLFTDSGGRESQPPEWRFVLQPSGEGERLFVSDAEPDADAMRLALLAVVRGLEAIDQPSLVTLMASNRFVRRGIRRDLAQWRELGWRWERFGKLVPIRDLDLWQRVDHALGIHRVDCVAGGIWNSDCRFSPSTSEMLDLARRQVETRGEKSSRLKYWGQEILGQFAGWGQPALSRSA